MATVQNIFSTMAIQPKSFFPIVVESSSTAVTVVTAYRVRLGGGTQTYEPR